MKKIEEILKKQGIWESLPLQKDLRFELNISNDSMIFFIMKGSLSLKVNDLEKFTVLSGEMFLPQFDSSYEITVLENSHFLICYTPMEAWYSEQKWIDDLFLDDNSTSGEFFKLPIKKMILRYLSLIGLYLEKNIDSQVFFELKRQELFFLFHYCYQNYELAQFLQCIISKDIKFRKFVVVNYQNARNVQALAKLANYSTSGFIKKFQKCFNESPYKWMQRQKAKQISAEIVSGVKSLQEIANEYKFSSYQHFSVFCKTKLGAPPTSILRKNIDKVRENTKR